MKTSRAEALELSRIYTMELFCKNSRFYRLTIFLKNSIADVRLCSKHASVEFRVNAFWYCFKVIK